MYELWDAESGNLTEEFATEAEALAAVRDAAAQHGRAYAEAYGLIFEDAGGRSRIIAQGAALVDRSLRSELHPPPARAS